MDNLFRKDITKNPKSNPYEDYVLIQSNCGAVVFESPILVKSRVPYTEL